MADTKLTALTASTSASTDDLLYVVDNPGGTPASKKITFDNFQKSISQTSSFCKMSGNTTSVTPPFSSQTRLHTVGADSDNIVNQADVFGGHIIWDNRRANGTAAAPSALLINDEICAFAGRGYGDATTYAAGSSGKAALTMYAAENWTSTANGTYLLLSTTANGSTTLNTALQCYDSQDVRMFRHASVGAAAPNVFGYAAADARVLTVYGTTGSNSKGVIELVAASSNTTIGNIIGQIDFDSAGQSGTRLAQIYAVHAGSTAGNLGSNLIFVTKADGGSLQTVLTLQNNKAANFTGILTSSDNASIGTAVPNIFGYSSSDVRLLTILGSTGVNSKGVIELVGGASNTTLGNIVGQIDFSSVAQTGTRLAQIYTVMSGTTPGNYGGNLIFVTKADSGTTQTVLTLQQDKSAVFAGVTRFQDTMNVGGGASATELRFLEPSGSGTNYTGFKAQAQAANVTYTLPAADATTSGQVLSSDAAGTLSWANKDSGVVQTLTFVIDGGGSAITTGIKGDIEVPFACTINQVTLLADQSGSIVVDIWKDTYANYPPTGADSITASAKPTISAATKSQDSTLTGWTTSITAGDILRFNVDSAATITRVTVSLRVTK